MRLFSQLLGLTLVSAVAARSLPFANNFHKGIWHPTTQHAASFLTSVENVEEQLTTAEPDSYTMGNLGRGLIRDVTSWASNALFGKQVQATPDAKDYPYWRFLPTYLANAVPEQGTVSWSAPCFQENTASVKTNADGKSWTVSVTVDKPSSALCNDMYLFGTMEGIKIESFFLRGTHTITWTPAKTVRDAELFDIKRAGIRVFRFVEDPLTTINCLLQTVLLFEPMLTQTPSAEAEARNVDFVTKYTKTFLMKNRSSGSVAIDESLINSGDFIGVIRLDGLDPMLSWAMGASTGHTTIAIRDPADNQLYIHESTTNGNYWPTNGIQRTPYQQWIKQADAAGYNFVWAPLSAESRANFNVTAALQFFRSTEGVDYGYYNMLMAWLDTEKDNYPCVAPDFTMCLTWSHVEILMGVLDHLAPSIADLLFSQAFNHRVGTTGLRPAEVLQYAYQNKSMSNLALLPIIVEDDSWNYSIKRYNQTTQAPSMVCCVFVCHMWKAGGLFDDLDREVNCGEFTNSDDYMLTLLDGKFQKPPQCVSADPDNQLCQLGGDYTLNFIHYASRDATRHMAETCPSLAPTYDRPLGC